MPNSNHTVEQLLQKTESLQKRQAELFEEIEELRRELVFLQSKESSNDIAPKAEAIIIEKRTIAESSQPHPSPEPKTSKIKSNLEKFIGENLINKVGIIITIIGVAIGAKYSIEHGLISPTTRIILGYLFGFLLLGVGIRLKKEYRNYSAVLTSGAIAIMYFITFSAYSIYSLMPQNLAFALMVVFTAFAIYQSISYNLQVVALIGLVGAYAVPFLLGNNDGNVSILFIYTTIINIGILVISLKKYWKLLFYSAFGVSWGIYLTWYLSRYSDNHHFALALIFLLVFFIIFYLTSLAYKLVKQEKFSKSDIVLLLLNSFIFYGIGYSIIGGHFASAAYLGLFTICNALVHFGASILIYKNKLADRNLFYLTFGLALVFITIAIPIQLKGNWVTLLWAGEALILYWIGSTKNVAEYRRLSYPVMILAFLSIVHDWVNTYALLRLTNAHLQGSPIFNVSFLSSLLFAGVFSTIAYLYIKRGKKSSNTYAVMSYAIPSILLLTIYFMFRLEIERYYQLLYSNSMLTFNNGGRSTSLWNTDIRLYKTIAVLCYSLLFVSILSFVNNQKIKSTTLQKSCFAISGIVLLVFLTQGLYNLSELRESYLNQSMASYYPNGVFHIWVRYVAFVFVAILLYAISKNRNEHSKLFDAILYASAIWILSSELISWMDMAGSGSSYKLGLSILWGASSLALVVIGIWQKKSYLRIGAIALFGFTLIKLFIYDINHLETISKTIVFISLGILLLIISFLYNKYKNSIS